MKKIPVIAGAIVLLLLAPLISRFGVWKTVHSWDAPAGTFGVDRDIILSVETLHAFADPLMIHEENRLVLSDGVHSFAAAVDLNFFPEVSQAVVVWESNGVIVSFPNGVSVRIPAEKIFL